MRYAEVPGDESLHSLTAPTLLRMPSAKVSTTRFQQAALQTNSDLRVAEDAAAAVESNERTFVIPKNIQDFAGKLHDR